MDHHNHSDACPLFVLHSSCTLLKSTEVLAQSHLLRIGGKQREDVLRIGGGKQREDVLRIGE
jgi:hypothetical protein